MLSQVPKCEAPGAPIFSGCARCSRRPGHPPAAASNSLVNVTAVDDAVNIQAIAAGSASNYAYNLSSTNSNPALFPERSFVPVAIGGSLDGGADAQTAGTPAQVYGFAGAYDGVGNLTGYTDSVMGAWGFSYDTLNRLVTSQNTATTSTSTQYANNYGCWSYDAFDNRTAQSMSTTPCGSNPPMTSWAHYNGNNQFTNTIQAVGGVAYDTVGDVINDGQNQYLYDGEGRICAVASTPMPGMTAMTGYVYDADGTRVAKGTISTWSCDPGVSGFTPTNDYILGPGGEQVTEMGMGSTTNGSTTTGLAWQHTNVYAAGTLIATYDNDGLHFYLNDPLGTRRAQTDYAGVLEQTCSSLPFGDGLACTGSTVAPTEHHFTGKERDSESGNDYFGARYYASTMGRFMSPDWSAKVMPVPYAKLDNPQSLNLYAYPFNNPLAHVDVDGHGELWDKFKAIFFAKVDVGLGLKLEASLGKHLKAGADAFVGVEKKVTSGGSTDTLKAEAGGGIKAGSACGCVSRSIEKQMGTNGEPDEKPAVVTKVNPHIGGESGSASGQASANELSITVAVPDTNAGATVGGTVGMDLDKASDFGAALEQKTVDTLFNMVVPQNIPISPPQVANQ